MEPELFLVFSECFQLELQFRLAPGLLEGSPDAAPNATPSALFGGPQFLESFQ